MGIFRTSSLGDSFSSDPERRVLRRQGKLSGYTEICSKGQVVLISKKLLSLKENHISQVKEFRAFLYMGKCKKLGLLKSFLSYASQLSRARAHWVMADSYHLP